MIHLQLDEQERVVLLHLLETCISDLRMEIAGTDNIDYKIMLKERKAVLMKLQEEFQLAQPMHLVN